MDKTAHTALITLFLKCRIFHFDFAQSLLKITIEFIGLKFIPLQFEASSIDVLRNHLYQQNYWVLFRIIRDDFWIRSDYMYIPQKSSTFLSVLNSHGAMKKILLNRTNAVYIQMFGSFAFIRWSSFQPLMHIM